MAVVHCYVPEIEQQDLINELRDMTQAIFCAAADISRTVRTLRLLLTKESLSTEIGLTARTQGLRIKQNYLKLYLTVRSSNQQTDRSTNLLSRSQKSMTCTFLKPCQSQTLLVLTRSCSLTSTSIPEPIAPEV
jgi:hypothetical protein